MIQAWAGSATVRPLKNALKNNLDVIYGLARAPCAQLSPRRLKQWTPANEGLHVE